MNLWFLRSDSNIENDEKAIQLRELFNTFNGWKSNILLYKLTKT